MRTLTGAVIAVIGLAASCGAAATAVVSISTSDPLIYTQNSGSHQLQVDFKVQLGAADTATDVLVYAGELVAYNPAVLTYNTITWGGAMTGPTTAADTSFVKRNYTVAVPTNHSFDSATVTGLSLGTPVEETGYFDGSLYPILSTGLGFNFSAEGATLLANQKAGALLFSILFDVNTTNIANSSIVLLDDGNYTNNLTATFDFKHGPSANSFYLDTNALLVQVQADVPAPASLLLTVTGLIGLGLRRRAKV